MIAIKNNKKLNIKQKLSLLSSNKGSSIVMVIIIMLFLSILGSMLLFTTYTSVVVKNTERNGDENFYHSTTAMDIVLLGFQGVVSDAMAKTYSDFLIEYTVDETGAPPSDIATTFKESFIENLTNATIQVGETDFEEIFDVTGLKEICINDVLAQHLAYIYGTTALSDANIYLSGRENFNYDYDFNLEITDTSFIIKNVILSYSPAENNFVSSIETDIVINFPDFDAMLKGGDENIKDDNSLAIDLSKLVYYDNWTKK